MPDSAETPVAVPLTGEQVLAVLESSAEGAVSSQLGAVVAACGSPLARATDVARLLDDEPGLTAALLELARSDYYLFPGPLGRVQHVVLGLGFDEVRNLVVAAAVAEGLYRPEIACEIDRAGLWAYQVGVAIGAEALAERTVGSRSADAFLAGLLHGMGKPAMARFLPETCEAVLGAIRRECCLWQKAERGCLEGGHASVGAWLAERWGLPSFVADVIRHYQAPEDAPVACRSLARIVHAAEVFARALDLGDAADPGVPRLGAGVWEACNLTEAMLDDLFDEILDRHARATTLIALAEGTGV